MMRRISEIIIHCTATPRGRHVTVAQIRECHVKRNGWNDIGYHYVIYLDGTVHRGRPESVAGAHCLGHNSQSIGVAYVGGVETDGRPADTRTPEQKQSLKTLVASLLEKYPGATVHGHNEFAAKACPSFSVAAEFAKKIVGIIVAIIMSASLTGCCPAKKTLETRERYDETTVESMIDRRRFAERLLEVADLTLSIDSVEIERLETDSQPSERMRTGKISVKLSRKTVVDATAGVTTEAETHKAVDFSGETETHIDTKIGGAMLPQIVPIVSVLVVIGWLGWKICRKKW